MNLYRSFGNLMETWVIEDSPSPDSPWLGNNSKDSPTSSSYMESNLRSESVDSGVETASCDTVLSTSGSVSTDHTEMDLFVPQRRLSPASISQSPVLYTPVPSSSSSSSPQFCPISEEKDSTSLHLKEEVSLQRTDSVHLKDKPKTLTVEEVLNRRPRTSLLPKRHTSDLGMGQRSENLGWRVNPSLPIRQMSDLCRRPVSMGHDDKQRSEGLAVGDNRELSPGLDYLEQVCQMLEGIAREQIHSRGVHPELEALWEDQDAQTLNTRQSDADEEDLNSHKILDNARDGMSKPQQRKYGHFRQRSASDTALSTIHLRKLNTHDRGQLMSTTDLLERAEDDEEKQFQTSAKTEKNKSHKHWRLKFGSFGKGESSIFTKSQQMQSSEKTSARRRLSKLFRKRRKTLPM